ncbi:MAG: PDZ domain-containing protein, partial [Vicinamibacteria bacterium]
GVIISEVDPEGAAAAARLHRGDIILEIDREAVHDLADYEAKLKQRADEKSLLLYIRRGEESVYIVVKR